MQEIGEQLDSAILAYAILLQLMHCSIASCVLHIAYRVGVRSPNSVTSVYNNVKCVLNGQLYWLIY